MSNRQLKLKTTASAGSKIVNTTTLSHVNPNAGGSVMLGYAKMLNRFTTNIYGETDLVETTNLDTEDVKIKQTLTISTAPATIGSGIISFRAESNNRSGSQSQIVGFAMKDNNIYTIKQTSAINYNIQSANEAGTYTVYIGKPEDATYTAAYVTGTVTTA